MWGPGWGSCLLVILVLCLSELVTVGLLIFSHGFLLTRQVVPFISTCHDFKLKNNIQDGTASADNGAGCWMPPTFNRSVILIVDALRYDFTTYNHSLKDENALPYQNKMPVFDNVLRSHARQSLLVPFVADAPTTTMQRLKGLTTGSLPTFIDASHNFASEEITEDNIIDQLVRSGKQITVLGDDTWASLFPRRFTHSHLFPSFDVMDLHTVDRGVKKHLAEELGKGEWKVLIAHFLGVDHCGHRYGPTHPEMEAKLREMNQVIESVVNMIERDTLLLVLGDHGMTSTGDHGGDSSYEVTSALFLYSPALTLSPHSTPALQSMAQVDLVPTLALALGVPVPFSSLGKVLEHILVTADVTEDEGDARQIQALELNVKQVQRYLDAYKDRGNIYPEDLWQKLKSLNKTISEAKLSPREQKRIFTEYLVLAKVMCQEIWAKFNTAEILSGLFLMFTALLLLLVFTIFPSTLLTEKISVVKRVILLTLIVNLLFVFSSYFTLTFLSSVAGCLIVTWLIKHRQLYAKTKFVVSAPHYISILLIAVLFLGSFSNSYVVMENYVVAFILLSLVSVEAITAYMSQHNKGAGGKGFKFSMNPGILLCWLAMCVMLICVRCSTWFWKCREEQYWCIPGQVHIPLTGLPPDAHNLRYFTSLPSLGLLIWLPRRWLLTCGNLNGMRFGVLLTRYTPLACGVLVAAYWALQAATAVYNVGIKEQIILPRLLFLASIVYLIAVFALPLLIYELHPSSKATVHCNSPTALIPQLYRRLKEKYSGQNKQSANIPVVYGLATGVSAPLVAVMITVLMVVVVVAGDGLTGALLLLFLSAAASLLVQAVSAWRTSHNVEAISKPGLQGVCSWFVLSLHGFYTTGHQPTFPSLHWAAAFIGVRVGEGGSGVGWNMNTAASAFLVGLNTYSSHLVFGLALPLVLLAPLALGVIAPKIRPTRFEGDEARHGEFTLVEKPDQTRSSLLSLSLSYILLHAAKVFFSAMAAFILRRHLMVWKIFAPHFIFEAVGFLVTSASVIIGLGFTYRVLGALTSWSEQLLRRS